MTVSLAEELIVLLEPIAASNGLDLVTVEVVGGARSRIVRVFLDRDGGIDIDTITDANAWISDALDGVERLAGPFTLEVSSPGIERVLRKPSDFERFAGRSVHVHLARPVEGRSRFFGRLVGLEGEDLIVEIDGQERRVPFAEVEKARLKADFGEVAGRNG
ncbi:MAG: ribosome maturation factor RimP [Actinobacteria bacterium]|nr:ribosome maturation factor RimP [Actinomycetota bacterium]